MAGGSKVYNSLYCILPFVWGERTKVWEFTSTWLSWVIKDTHKKQSSGFFYWGELCSWVTEEEGKLIGPSVSFDLLNSEPPEYINYSKIKFIKKIRDFMDKRELRVGRIFRGWKKSKKVLGVHWTVGEWSTQRHWGWTACLWLAMTWFSHLQSGMIRNLPQSGHQILV